MVDNDARARQIGIATTRQRTEAVAATLIGFAEAAALSAAADAGVVRVRVRHGDERVAWTADYWPSRINLLVDDGTVTWARVG